MNNEQQTQDLRESAVFLYGKYADENIPVSEFVDAMLQFAADVSAEKDKMLETYVNALQLANDIRAQDEKRIAELEKQVEEWRKAAFTKPTKS